ncbi:histidinol-phosphatase [Brevibacterium sp. p3-SID960]|uniref:histidinol-phosphatase n=1 Tax=Brevibacterium sp. p3-SID960 TaxID=2916063 RepID=UPI0021A25D38|nr:histidinol-phosphatase [Brevibacterium sp. p3-SID960]MCT1691174.1 histidinol-phosphatase [Brevibacterium sp. p3-SID960]
MDDLALALRLADEADAISLPRFRTHDFHVSTKPDLTPVTDADQAVEEMLRKAIGDERPEDAFYGEEFGSRGQASRRWIVDPIDGTKNFVRGVPVYSTLIALYDSAQPVVGVVSAPALGMRWYAAAGSGAFRTLAPELGGGEPERLRVSTVGTLGDASLSYSSLTGWASHRDRERFIALTDQVWRTRAYGDFWSYMMVAEGTVDIACEPELELYDMAALVPIITEAGGSFTDLDGQPGPFGANGLATNGRLHTEVLTYV